MIFVTIFWVPIIQSVLSQSLGSIVHLLGGGMFETAVLF